MYIYARAGNFSARCWLFSTDDRVLVSDDKKNNNIQLTSKTETTLNLKKYIFLRWLSFAVCPLCVCVCARARFLLWRDFACASVCTCVYARMCLKAINDVFLNYCYGQMWWTLIFGHTHTKSEASWLVDQSLVVHAEVWRQREVTSRKDSSLQSLTAAICSCHSRHERV